MVFNRKSCSQVEGNLYVNCAKLHSNDVYLPFLSHLLVVLRLKVFAVLFGLTIHTLSYLNSV